MGINVAFKFWNTDTAGSYDSYLWVRIPKLLYHIVSRPIEEKSTSREWEVMSGRRSTVLKSIFLCRAMVLNCVFYVERGSLDIKKMSA